MILKILTHLKRETKHIQLNGGQHLKLKNQIVFKKSDTFPDDLIKKCKDHANEAIIILIEVKK